MTSETDSIDGTFDVDVVGLTDFVEFRPDGELFDFDSGTDYGLFDEKDFYTGTFGLNTNAIVKSGKKVPTTQNIIRTRRRNKVWNEMEKDLFQKGLELFGQNWRKISKFIATKTPYQIKVYYKNWSETANVIHDSDHTTTDACIYLPENLVNKHKDLLCESYSHEVDQSTSLSLSSASEVDNQSPNSYQGSVLGSFENEMICGDELVVSSLHDWSLGSQVSIVEEVVTSSPMLSHGLHERKEGHPICESNSAYSPQRNLNLAVKFRKKNNLKDIGKHEMNLNTENQDLNLTLTKDQNIIGLPKPHSILLGQVIHITKNDNEESDVDIDGSDDEAKDEFLYNKDNIVSESLTEEERKFSINIFGDVNTYIGIKHHILEAFNKKNLSHISLAQVFQSRNPRKFCRKDISKVFSFLEKREIINFKHEALLHSDELYQPTSISKINREGIEMSKRKKRSPEKGKKLGGGVTLSHDASGAVLDTIHVPEVRSQEGSIVKRCVSPHHIKLQNCLRYDSRMKAPFSTVIHPSALILLDIHAHSSFSEVMGLLGGFLDHVNSRLYITMVVATEATSSGIDCDMSPLSQQEAADAIIKTGADVVGWYHSHPTFLPNPSERDLESQTHLQSWFQRQNSPFVGLIISPFCKTVFSGASLLRCIVLDKNKNPTNGVKNNFLNNLAPYSLPWKINDNHEVTYDDIENAVIELLVKIKSHPESVDWSGNYKNGFSFANKLCQSLLTHIPKNLKSTIKLVKNTICCNL